MIKRFYNAIRIRMAAKRFQSDDYLEAYANHTDVRTAIDPQMAIGGLWESMASHQFDFLVSQGLQRSNSLLDIGCGSLRGGLRFIDYLDAEKYVGFDISDSVIEAGRKGILEKGLSHKKPLIFVNDQKNLRFDHENLQGKKFDFLLAQSVFSHLMPEHIVECFSHISTVMDSGSKFLFTFHPSESFRQRSLINFEYNPDFFHDLANKHDFNIEDLSVDYHHPRGQCMMRASVKV